MIYDNHNINLKNSFTVIQKLMFHISHNIPYYHGMYKMTHHAKRYLKTLGPAGVHNIPDKLGR